MGLKMERLYSVIFYYSLIQCILDDTACVVEVNDLKQLEIGIRNHCENRKYTEENCLKHAKHFSQDKKYTEYLRLYYSML